MRRFFLITTLFSISTTWAQAPASETLFPQAFAGWEKKKTQRGSTAQAVDPEHAGALAEYGLSGFETATYVRDDRTTTVRALRFPDATGSYGAFTYFRTPQMADEKFCDEAASERTRIVMRCSNVVLDVKLDRVTAMAASDLRALAKAVPRAVGHADHPPNTPLYLPEYARKNVVFALGPLGYAHAGSHLPADHIDFSRAPEIAVGKFEADAGVATATVVHYPTPAIAIQQLRRLENWSKVRPANPDPAKLNTFEFKRSGPLLAVVGGEITQGEARAILDRIGYDAEISWTEPTKESRRDNIGSIVVVALTIAAIIFGASVVMGIFFGGFRLLVRRLFPKRFANHEQQDEFITLKLED